MRDIWLSLLKDIKLVSYRLTDELPYDSDSDKTALYLKNSKYIYVDNDITLTEDYIPLLSGYNIDNVVNTINIYVSNDAKKIPKDYQTMIQSISSLKDHFIDYYKRSCNIDISYDGDLMITKFEFKLTTIS
jgi:hypothetical protein